MRFLEKPDDDVQNIWEKLIENFTEPAKISKLYSQIENITRFSNDFEQHAKEHRTYLLSKSKQCILQAKDKKKEKEEEFKKRFGVSVEEIKSVYTRKMSAQKSPGRKFYDKIMSKAPDGRCPICCHGVACQLDHYLPKSHFPFLCVTPLNLIPSCRDCNTIKQDSIASSEEEEPLHPYFDNFEDFTWLAAKVVEGEIVSVKFYVDPDSKLSEKQKSRLESHLKLYELGERYSTIVTSEIRELGDRFDQYFSIGGVQAVKCAIQREARLKQKENPNSFYAAMLRGMLASDWYCDVGFRNIGKGVLAAPLQLAGNVPQTRSTTDFQNLSLEKFLQLPNSDIAKYEHVKGIVRKKAGLKAKYLELQDHLSSEINRVVKSGKSAYALPDSRCTFGNRSLLPDIAVFQGNNIPTDENGEIQKCFNLAPDWMIEILTPERSSPRVIENILFSLQHGSQLGWLIDSDDYSVIVFHPDKLAEFKERDDQLSIIDAISNWQLTAAGLFALMD